MKRFVVKRLTPKTKEQFLQDSFISLVSTSPKVGLISKQLTSASTSQVHRDSQMVLVCLCDVCMCVCLYVCVCDVCLCVYVCAYTEVCVMCACFCVSVCLCVMCMYVCV